MERITAGHLQQQEQVQQAIPLLENASFPAEKISAFYVNPAEQHDLYPIGGDRDDSGQVAPHRPFHIMNLSNSLRFGQTQVCRAQNDIFP